jgi:hypothetical protein
MIKSKAFQAHNLYTVSLLVLLCGSVIFITFLRENENATSFSDG